MPISKNTEYQTADVLKIPEIIQKAIDNGDKNATILVDSGDYYIQDSIVLNSRGLNLTIKAVGKVRLIGGKKLHNFDKVNDADILRRFIPEAQQNILQCDLSQNGLSSTGEFVTRGFNRDIAPSHSEIFMNGLPMNLSQYPKKGNYTLISGFDTVELNYYKEQVGKLENGFLFTDDRPTTWEKADDIWVHGYWSYDWANSYERVAVLDTEKRLVQTCYPFGVYDFRIGQRFCFLNILEEVTDPGDYYIDQKNNVLYFYPFENMLPDEVIISTIDKPIFAIEDSENISFEGFNLEATRGHAITITGSEQIYIKDFYLKNIGNYAIKIVDSKNIEVTGCTVHDCGDGGVTVTGGDRLTLEPADVYVNNNHIYNIAKWNRCYQPAINMSGVGITARNNLIHDCPHNAILFFGNEMTIENNEIYSAVMETGDSGAIYSGRDYTFRGNRICKNYIHHLGGVRGYSMGIYNDDCISGTIMDENVIFECFRGVYMGGGRDFSVRNNVFVDCYPAVDLECRGVSFAECWRENIEKTLRSRFYNVLLPGEIKSGCSAMDLPYIDHYPELRDIDNYYKAEGEVFIPGSAIVEGNVICSERKIEFSHWAEQGDFRLNNNYNAKPEDFNDFAFSDFTLNQSSNIVKFNHKSLPIENMGLIESERKLPSPPKVITNLKIEDDQLILTLKNKSERAVTGDIKLFVKKTIDGFTCGQTTVEINGHEDKVYTFPIPSVSTETEIEARSTTAGIRPSRIFLNKGIK